MSKVIEVKDLVIRYRCFKKMSIKKSILKLAFNKPENFTAIDGVSFSVDEGQIIGIVGRNGSGKSTMLRALAGIFAPDVGSIDLKGRSISLMAIGAGFQTKLTGYENIILSGLLIGFTEEQIRARINEIIEFSELGDFIYKPVKSYSSGMYSKLSFSIAVVLQTDILLIDEVLSVGDMHFKKKSGDKMLELIKDDKKTVVIVSHSNKTIKQLCDKVVWIDNSRLMAFGDTDEVLNQYEEFMNNLGKENKNA